MMAEIFGNIKGIKDVVLQELKQKYPKLNHSGCVYSKMLGLESLVHNA